jgi:hypothetical protein
MAKFYVTVVSKSYYTVEVEAQSRNEAVEKFNWDDIDWFSPEHIDSDIDNVEEIKEEENGTI